MNIFFFKKSPFQFAFKNSFIHIIDQVSENNEEINNYAAQDLQIMNTMEATNYFCQSSKRPVGLLPCEVKLN